MNLKGDTAMAPGKIRELMLEGPSAADREGRQAGRAGPVLPGGLHAALFLPEPGQEMVWRHRAHPRRPDDPADAEAGEEARHGAGGADLRGGDDGRLLQHRRRHRRRRQVSRQVPQGAYPAGRRLLREVLLQAGQSRLSVFDTQVCKLGVYICYDRHFPKAGARWHSTAPS